MPIYLGLIGHNSSSAVRVPGLSGQADAEQTIDLGGATGGDYELNFGGDVTGAIAFDASDATIEGELEGLTSIGAGNVSVSSLVVTFQNDLGSAPQATMTVTSDTTTGGTGVTVSTTSAGSSGTVAEVELTPDTMTIVDVEDPATRRALARHSAIGQYEVVAANNVYRDAVGSVATLPANSA